MLFDIKKLPRFGKFSTHKYSYIYNVGTMIFSVDAGKIADDFFEIVF